MGLLCSKGFPKEYEDIIAGARKKPQKTGESTTPAVEEIDVADTPKSAAEPPKPKPVEQRREEDVLLSNVLQRAKAGGQRERIAAAMASTDEVDVADLKSEDEEADNSDERVQRVRKLLGGKGPTSSIATSPAADEEEEEEARIRDRYEHLHQLQMLLGGTGPTSSSNAPPPAAMEEKQSHSPVNSGSSGLDTLKAQGYSEEVMRRAARLGLPLPSTEEEDQEYDATDAYMDDLLGIPAGKRPAAWEPQPDSGRPSFEGPNSGRPLLDDPSSGRPSLANRPSLGTASQRQSLEGGRPTLGAESSTATPYMGKVIGGWASIDADKSGVGDMQRVLPDIREAGASDTLGAGAARMSLQPSSATSAANSLTAFPASRDSFGASAGSPLQQGWATQPRGSLGNSKATVGSVTEMSEAQRNSFGGSLSQHNSFGGATELPPRDSYAAGTLAAERDSFNMSRPPWQTSDVAKLNVQPRESFGGAAPHTRHGPMTAMPQRESFGGTKAYQRHSFGEPAPSSNVNSNGTTTMLPPWQNFDEATSQQPQQQQQRQQQHPESYGVASMGRWGNGGRQGAAQQNNFGGAAAMLDSFGRAAAAAPPRESFGRVAARAPQQAEVSTRVADGDRPAPKRRAKVAS